MIVYPHSSPIILTDDVFADFFGENIKDESTPYQRQAAYMDAEKKATTYIHTFLLPTTVTGTYSIRAFQNIITDYSYVHSIGSVTLIQRNNDSDCSVTETSSCAYIRDDSYGIIDPYYLAGVCRCNYPVGISQVRIAYTAGLPTGTITQADYLHALATLADIALNEVTNQGGNEGVGDVGIETFSNKGYAEQRVKLIRTALGTSARANWCANILKPLRRVRRAGL